MVLDPDRKAIFGVDAFVPIINQVLDPGIVWVRADSPYKTLKDLVDAAKKAPNTIRTATTGILSDDHLAILMLEEAAPGAIFRIVHLDRLRVGAKVVRARRGKNPVTYLWPEMLWLLAAAPALVGAYVLLLRRKKKGVLRYASLSLVKDAIGPGQRIRRHVPPALFLAAMIAALVAIARPSAVITLPSEQRTIILAIDVSLSMRATDVEPNRLVAAQAAAKAFVAEQPKDVRIGIVSFAGTASLVQQPTQNREDLIAAIDRLQLQRHTAIGSGLIVSLAAVFPDEDIDLESVIFGRAFARERNAPIEGARKAERKPFQPVPPGSYASAAIILLTDGRRTTGPDPVEAARMAADRGVRVFTVGFGTAAGSAVDIDGWSIYMRFDEETLKAIAEVTRAQYFHAGSAADLQKVYETLNAKFVLERKETEITALFAAGAAVLAAASAALSILWFRRIV